MKQILENLTKYNVWANNRICEIIKPVDKKLLEKDLHASFKSIRGTLYHLWGAEWIWFERLHGKSPMDWPGSKFKGNFDEFQLEFLQQSGKYYPYVNKLSEKDLSKDFEYANLEGKKFKNTIYNTIVHVMNHSTFHRGQIIGMLREAGVTEFKPTDYIMFIREVLQK